MLFLLPLEGFPPALLSETSGIATLLETGTEHASTIVFCVSGLCYKTSFSSRYHAVQYLTIPVLDLEYVLAAPNIRTLGMIFEGLTLFKVVLLIRLSTEPPHCLQPPAVPLSSLFLPVLISWLPPFPTFSGSLSPRQRVL